MRINNNMNVSKPLYGLDIEGNGLGSLVHMLGAISERQKITTNNLANAHTPGYTAREISFSELLGQMDSPFETRLSQQMGASMAMEGNTGQPVSMQKELVDMQKNLLFYNMAVRRISTVITGMKTASQVGR
jgi:flagellar basal body rod protein FlgB